MTKSEIKAAKDSVLERLAKGKIDVAAATAELAELEQAKPEQGLYCKVSQKGALSIYGLQRMPVTLYIGQWERLWKFMGDVQAFAKEHADELERKPAKSKAA